MENLTVADQFALNYLLDDIAIAFYDIGQNRQPVVWRRVQLR
ncbi:hypothetical protein SDC9_65484 [bioreactor metagenome]|uniref:Uncharacterized protein n=1 Tax=bioreactor metagenome TaxID=1076179 RepID=A0A644XS66_9ZZZZ